MESSENSDTTTTYTVLCRVQAAASIVFLFQLFACAASIRGAASINVYIFLSRAGIIQHQIDAAINTISRYFRIKEGLKFRQNQTKHYKQNGRTT